MSLLHPAPSGQPVLTLGLLGFSPSQRTDLAGKAQHATPGGQAWRLSGFWEADAWWINGSNTRLLPDGNLRVQAGMPTERAVTLSMEEVNRPIAFSTPLTSKAIEPRCAFSPDSQAQIEAVLMQFVDWLQPVLFKAALGGRIIDRGTALRGRVYHVRHQSRLLAVLDFRRGKAALLASAHPTDLLNAVWDQRPPSASEAPPGFIACTPAQIIWTHVRHSGQDQLPERYRSETIYYRHVPRVPMAWLGDSMLSLLSTLSGEPCDLRSLGQRTGIESTTLARDLACLYYAGAITTTPMKAAQTGFTPNTSPTPRTANEPWNSMQGQSTLPPIDSDRTVPAMLRY